MQKASNQKSDRCNQSSFGKADVHENEDIIAVPKDAPIAIYEIDLLTFKFKWANQLVSRLLGYSEQELTALSVTDLLPESSKKIFQENLAAALKGKQFFFNSEVQVKTKNGSSLWGSFNSKVIFSDGKPTSVLVFAQDITERKKVEESLRQSEERFSKAFENSSALLAITRVADNRIVDVNKTFLQVTQYSHEEVIGHTSRELNLFLKPDQRDQMFDLALKQGYESNQEMEIKAKSGKLLTLLFSAVTIQLYGEKHLLSTAIDITRLKKLQKKLKSVSANLQNIIETLEEGIVIAELDGKVLECNDKCLRLIRCTKAEFLGKNIYDFFLTEERQQIIEEALKILKNGKDTGEFRIIRNNNSSFWAEISATPLYNWNNKPQVILGVIRDITERKKAKDMLETSEERFRLVAEASNMMVYEIDVKAGKPSIIRGFEELVGYKLNEVTSNDWVHNRIHPDDSQRVLAEYQTCIEKNQVGYSTKYRFRHKNGHFITVQDTAKVVKDREGKVIRVIGGVVDISQIEENRTKIERHSKELEELVKERTKQLRDSERLATIGTTAGMVGHDIRNPLQAMMSDVYLLKEGLKAMPELPVKDEVVESLEGLENNITYINKIVADLQDYARPLKPEYSYVDISEVMQALVSTAGVPPEIRVTLSCNTFKKIKTEPTFIRRALTNLVNNAIQAMPNGGDLELTCYKAENRVLLTVADTGVGIPENVKPKLFVPMMTTKSKGQGLGLAVVKRLVESINGTISFESQEGKGTKFTIELRTS
jgi:PAS domain S-box-containing protein